MKDGFYWVIDLYHSHADEGYPEVAQLRGGTFFFTTSSRYDHENRAVANDPRWVRVIGERLEPPQNY